MIRMTMRIDDRVHLLANLLAHDLLQALAALQRVETIHQDHTRRALNDRRIAVTNPQHMPHTSGNLPHNRIKRPLRIRTQNLRAIFY